MFKTKKKEMHAGDISGCRKQRHQVKIITVERHHALIY